jgi:hypothetical protein
VVDVDGDGQLELVVLLVDNPSQQNQGFYQLGRGLGADGTVTGWTGWLGHSRLAFLGEPGRGRGHRPAGGPSPRQRSHGRGVDQQRRI